MVSVHLTNVCNNFCPFCMGSKGIDQSTIPTEKVLGILDELVKLGVKSIALGGGGDATCHPDLAIIIRHASRIGLEIGIYTNACVVTEEVFYAICQYCSWLRISLDADSPETYRLTHGMPESAFANVLSNIGRFVAYRNVEKPDFIIGAGYLLGRQTLGGVYNAAVLYKALGMDYIRIRPFYNNYDYKQYSEADLDLYFKELDRCLTLQDETFMISMPKNRVDWLSSASKARSYKVCNAHNFTTIISANQKVYLCCFYENNEDFCLGDLARQSFQEIWLSERRRKVVASIDLSLCPDPCILDGHNCLLWSISKDMLHQNFL